MIEDIEIIARNISRDLGASLQTRPYVGIFDYQGNILYSDKDLDKYIQLISDFVNLNFGLMNVGDHSIPFSGKNLVLFKVNNKSIVVIYTLKGYLAQLLSFKSKIPEISPKILEHLTDLPELINEIVLDLASDEVSLEEQQPEEARFKVFPTFTEKAKKKEKYSLEDMSIIRYCDGNMSLREIIKNSGVKTEKVYDILEKFIEKKVVKYRIDGKPLLTPYLVEEISNSDIKLGIVTEKEREIADFCDGKRIVDEIKEELSRAKQMYVELEDLKDNIKSLLKKKKLRMRFRL